MKENTIHRNTDCSYLLNDRRKRREKLPTLAGSMASAKQPCVTGKRSNGGLE